MDLAQLDENEFAKLKMCFAPESAAIVGASTDPMKFGGRALKFCLERGYAGRLYPVNARNEIVQGVKAYPSIADLPEAPEIVVIAVPAPLVRENLIAAGEKGAKVAIVYGAQFAEAGVAGQQKQDELVDIARSHGMRMIGPNCMGVISLASGFVASFTAAPEHHDGNGWPDPGTISVASQSGAVGIQIFAQLRDRGLGLANWISTGNQADIDVADAIAYYAGDPETRSIAVYMEDCSRGLKLAQALERARQAGKPVVALKVGTTPSGGEAARSHTASMFVEDRMVADLFHQYGVLRADSVNELIDLSAAANTGVVPSTRRVAAVSVSGGGAVMITDKASEHGLELIDYQPEALKTLQEQNAFVVGRNPIDVSAPSMSNMDITGGHLAWGQEQGTDVVLGYISHVPLVPRTRDKIMSYLLTMKGRHPDQFVAVAMNAHPEDRRELVQTGMAVFDDPSMMTASVAKLIHCGEAQQRPPSMPNASGAAGASTDLLRDLVPFAEIVAVDNVQDALNFRNDKGAIVLKLAAEKLAHKTELDGVAVNLESDESVQNAFGRLQEIADSHRAEYPDIHITASSMVNGVEMLVGVRQDPCFGPLIVCGTGGVMTELHDDLVYRKTPFDKKHG